MSTVMARGTRLKKMRMLATARDSKQTMNMVQLCAGVAGLSLSQKKFSPMTFGTSFANSGPARNAT